MKKNDNDDDSPFSFIGNFTSALLFNISPGMVARTFLGMTVALYVLNQKHLLPKPLSAVVSKTLFWPTLPITACRRIGTWMTVVDGAVVIGGAPIGFMGLPERLYEEYGVRGVVNMCKEYRGPTRQYEKLGMKELWLPTVDHFEPSVEDLKTAVSFIESYKAKGHRVYVHCRAGHGRSAAAVFAYLLNQDLSADLQQLNAELCQIRNVRKGLWKQPNVKAFHSFLKNGGKIGKYDVSTDGTEMDETVVGIFESGGDL
jgi:atypical dual specificity phosphatase